MDPTTRKALGNLESWKRGAVMLLFFLLLAVATPLLMLISLVGWLLLLVQGQVPESIRDFGRSLAAWYAQTTRYLTGDARRRPFPFEDLDCPTDEPLAEPRYARASAAVSPAAGAAPPAATPGQTASKKAGGKKAGGKKTGKKAGSKKAGKKKTAKKKTAKKTASRQKDGPKAAGENEVASQASERPAAADRDPGN